MSVDTGAEQPSVRHLDIGDDDDAVRLDRWLRRTLPDVPYGQLAKWLRTGQIRVDGRRAKPGQRLSAGQTVRLPPLTAAQAAPPRTSIAIAAPIDASDAADLQSRVLFRDDALIALNKPSGLAVQGGSKTTRHLDAMLDALRFGAAEKPRLVHRLDKDTSGVLLLARNAATARRLTATFRSRDVVKVYWALVAGIPAADEGQIDVPLLKTPGQGGEKMRPAKEGGQSAVTRYAIVDQAGQKVAWLNLNPLTGRTHQLRAHCAALGTPIVGDGKYGGKAAFIAGLPNKLHLHARSVTLPHPSTGVRMDVVAPLSGHCADSWAMLGFAPDKADFPTP
ncbi:MAG: RluA family pseudouridine synthase [Alphaproteobacteria bacterium]|nr:RluA family pseudouridine synthase [Alphaproteobacteria bacterium]